MDALTSGKRVKSELVPFGKLIAMLTTLKRKDPLQAYETEVLEAVTADVPLNVLALAVRNLLTKGSGWFPSPPELRQACEAARLELRAQMAFQPCVNCEEQSGWVTVVRDGVPYVERCACWTAHQRKVAALASAKPLALAAGEE